MVMRNSFGGLYSDSCSQDLDRILTILKTFHWFAFDSSGADLIFASFFVKFTSIHTEQQSLLFIPACSCFISIASLWYVCSYLIMTITMIVTIIFYFKSFFELYFFFILFFPCHAKLLQRAPST